MEMEQDGPVVLEEIIMLVPIWGEEKVLGEQKQVQHIKTGMEFPLPLVLMPSQSLRRRIKAVRELSVPLQVHGEKAAGEEQIEDGVAQQDTGVTTVAMQDTPEEVGAQL